MLSLHLRLFGHRPHAFVVLGFECTSLLIQQLYSTYEVLPGFFTIHGVLTEELARAIPTQAMERYVLLVQIYDVRFERNVPSHYVIPYLTRYFYLLHGVTSIPPCEVYCLAAHRPFDLNRLFRVLHTPTRLPCIPTEERAILDGSDLILPCRAGQQLLTITLSQTTRIVPHPFLFSP